MQRLRSLIEAVAPTHVSVLIEGATGTGKELVAESLHRLSRRNGTLVPFNVCALADSMFEDALFGHARGAFTGAIGETLGFLREANGGTAFFDEISGLAVGSQAKLLRAIETGVFRPIGSARDARSDFRTVAATNERLEQLVASGRFRADLAHRLSGIIISVPALAERLEDVPLLVAHFLRRSRPASPLLVTPEAMRLLQDQPWTGNVRELKQVVDASAIFARGGLDADAVAMVLGQRARSREDRVGERRLSEHQQLLKLLASVAWDTEIAADRLGVHRTTIYRRMRRLGIPVPTETGVMPARDGFELAYG